uniref:ADOR78 n=1 Tax=Adoxophyes orana granulovirus TaxID=170617 RepID=A0A0A7UYS5_GVAO|nr:ADOR78 [Adoxophyes orana granulovirus]
MSENVDTLHLYTFKPKNLGYDMDSDCQSKAIFVHGILESVNDSTKSKLACFFELKQEQLNMLKQLKNDMIERATGNFYRNHILLHMLNWYNDYCEEFDDFDSSFDNKIVEMTQELVSISFELFSCMSKVIVYVRYDADESHNIMGLLRKIESRNIINVYKIVDL